MKRRTGNYAGEDRVRKRGHRAWADKTGADKTGADKQRGQTRRRASFGNLGGYNDNTAVFEVCERVIWSSAGVQGGVQGGAGVQRRGRA